MDWPLLLAYLGVSLAGGLGMYLGIGGAFEVVYYRRRRAQADAWKTQPRRWLSPAMQRQQLALGTANMTLGSVLSGVFVYHVATGGYTTVYFEARGAGGVGLAVLSTVAYFLLTDAGLYWAHRIYHAPWLFRRVHRHHHRYTSPTAFTAMAMHPIEFLTYQGVMALPLFVLPVHVVGLVLVLVYQNYVALVDHSGILFRSWLPWQPPARFHDDHHVHFHVNYGQNLGVWDRLFGTYRRVDRRYGVEVFGGRGAPLSGAAGEAPQYVDYSAPPARPAGVLEAASGRP